MWLASVLVALVGGILWRLWAAKSSLAAQLKDAKSSLAAEKDERNAERRGRIRAETDIRELRLKMTEKTSTTKRKKEGRNNGFFLEAIGHMHSCFSERNGTPRQPLLVPSSLGKVVLKPGLSFSALEGLSLYSHCWVLYVFHKNTDLHQRLSVKSESNSCRRGFKTKVAVPRLNGRKLGVFATRSPHRPAPIGLSVAKIESVTGGTLLLSGIDIVDGSPVLDIKPYIPFCDQVKDALAPLWVNAISKGPFEPLRISNLILPSHVVERIETCWSIHKEKSLFASKSKFVDLVREVLSRDIRSVYQRVLSSNGSSEKRTYHVVLEGIDIAYQIDSKCVLTIVSVGVTKEGKLLDSQSQPKDRLADSANVVN